TGLRNVPTWLHVGFASTSGVLLGLGCSLLFKWMSSAIDKGNILAFEVRQDELLSAEYMRPMAYSAMIWGAVAWAAVGLRKPSLTRCLLRCLCACILVSAMVFVCETDARLAWLDVMPVRALLRTTVSGTIVFTLSLCCRDFETESWR